MDLYRFLSNKSGFQDGHFAGYWIGKLNSPDGLVRCQAIRALGAIGPSVHDLVPRLVTILREDPNWGPRGEAALALSKMGAAAEPAIPALTDALNDSSPMVRMNAALALNSLGERAAPAVPALIQAVQDRRNLTSLPRFHHNIREMAAIALGKAGKGNAEAMEALSAALDEAQTPQARRAMAQALGDLGPVALPAADLIRPLLNGSTPEVRLAAEIALAQIENREQDAAIP